MTNIPDEQILEFCRAAEQQKDVWFWDENPKDAELGRPQRIRIDLRVETPGFYYSFFGYIPDGEDDGAWWQNFSLSKPQVYEDGKWYSAKVLKVLNGYIKICCHYNSQLNRFICDGLRYSENDLTNIRPIPPELWEGEG